MNAMKNVATTGKAAFLAMTLVLSQPAAGQALRGHDTNAPVDVAADRIEVQDRADRAIFSGNVVARQGDLTLNASRVTVAYSDAGGIQIDRLTATGGVRLESPSETARGEYAIYDLNNRIITMLGGVTLTRGESSVNGARLVLSLDTGRAVLDGGAAGGGATSSEDGRVTGTFTVPQRTDD
jgi:lipopolysaccharide export system protein LptA